MLRKSTLLAVAASAALGLAILSPGTASAYGGHSGMHGGHGGHGMHGGHGGRIGHWPHRHHDWYVRYHRPIWYARPVVYGVRTVTPGPCTCLSKEYTPEGAVLFKDNCTNEMAMNPPESAPQQTGELQQQTTAR